MQLSVQWALQTSQMHLCERKHLMVPPAKQEKNGDCIMFTSSLEEVPILEDIKEIKTASFVWATYLIL